MMYCAATPRFVAGRELALARAVTRLPPKLGDVYRLRVAGHGYHEIGRRLAVPIGTVKSRVASLTARLRKDMEKWLVK